ncbi:MAG TPA: hypothetical protein PL054_07400 [Clostridia bacterium]|nr:MAG: hypothetical protein BWX97_01931 [Firmicutes bacterium ADurb.Bin146]HOD93683.1 hypothetical protein [Clostridia bacterium]
MMTFADYASVCYVLAYAADKASNIMREKSKKLARSAILLAIMMILIYLRTIVPGYQLAFYFLASLVLGIIIIEYGPKQGIIFTISAFILSLIMPIDKILLLLFYSFFGIYGLIKHLIEKIKSRILIMIVKLIYFSIVFFINMYFAAIFTGIVPAIMLKYNIWIVFGISLVVFILYDIMYSSFSDFYINKIKRYIK